MDQPDSETLTDGLHCPGLPAPAASYAGSVYLDATTFFDIDHPTVRQFVDEAIGDAQSQRERAVRLFYAVRDRIRYDPYNLTYDPKAYQASSVIAAGSGWCVPKAGLLAACARAVGIPSAIGLADVANHLTTDKLRERMGGVNVFYDHGYAAMYVEGRWLKTVPAFNIELCERFGVRPTEFDGVSDALYQEFDVHDRRHMEYLREHGTWSNLPLEQIKRDFAKYYPGIAERAGKTADGPADLFEG